MIPDLLAILLRSATAFVATNLDDIVLLVLFFSQIGTTLKKRHIIAGQYLGFAALVVISLPGFLGGLVLPRPWIGLLGIVPIVIGLSQLPWVEAQDETEQPTEPPEANGASCWHLLSPQTTHVAALTLANGGDNVGIYMPMFASSDGLGLGLTLTVFFSLVGVWCLVAYRLATAGGMAVLLSRYGSRLVPFVLMGLGGVILVDSRTLEYRGLTALTLTILVLSILHLLRTARR